MLTDIDFGTQDPRSLSTVSGPLEMPIIRQAR